MQKPITNTQWQGGIFKGVNFLSELEGHKNESKHGGIKADCWAPGPEFVI